jgi:alkylation response protein AidB-like acyl-CoA dehydrogenase
MPEGLAEAIRTTSEIGSFCGSTAFLLWCQNTCVWYLANTGNAALRERHLQDVATARTLGGTAFSNPMKHFAGLESLKLKARRERGGYIVNGVLPWVSNLGLGHLFGTVIDAGVGRVAALVRVDGKQVRLGPSGRFAALEGTATYSLRFEEAYIPDEDLLGAPAEPFVDRIRPGFVLLQLGIAFGIIRGALRDITRANRTLAAVNRFLPDRPEALESDLLALEAEAGQLAKIHPPEPDSRYLKAVLRVRLEAAQLTTRAAFSALQHAGAPGFLVDSAPQRRVREALFFSILTPSVKHLRKVLVS